jgi:hypothetical protein
MNEEIYIERISIMLGRIHSLEALKHIYNFVMRYYI